MYATYKLRASELDQGFLENLKSLFGNREIEIAISETADIERDETAYLLESPANRERLLKSVENIAHRRELVTVDLDTLK